MEEAIAAMGALARAGRLRVFRLLIKAGRHGLSAGEIAKPRGFVPQTLSGYYAILSNAGLLASQRLGRSTGYRGNNERRADMLARLFEHCFEARPECFDPLFATFALARAPRASASA